MRYPPALITLAILFGFLLGGSSGLCQTVNNPNFSANGGPFGVAQGWTGFGGNKWESSYQGTAYGWSQGLADIPATGQCGIYQQVSVTTGVTYQLAAESKVSDTANYRVEVGIAPGGQTDPSAAVWSPPANPSNWVVLTTQATAQASVITIFLRARNLNTQFQLTAWAYYDNVTLVVADGGPTGTPTTTAAANTPTPTGAVPPVAPDYWDPRLNDLYVSWEAPALSPGQTYWRLVSCEYQDPNQSGGTHHMYFRCLDLNGAQLAGVRVVQEWPTGSADTTTPNPPEWGNIPMYGSGWCPPDRPGPYSGLVGDGLPSYRVRGMGLPCNGHVNFRMTFRKAIAVGQATPTPSPTMTPVVPSGPSRWKLTYVRQIGFYMNHNPLGNHVAEVFVSLESGLPARNTGLTNRYNNDTAVFGYTDNEGYLRVVLNPPTNPYDIHVYHSVVPSDQTPDLHWYGGGWPYSGHYSFECHFRYYVHEDSTFHPDPLHPVYHYDQTDGLNDPVTRTHPPGWETDAHSLTNWASYHAQTFVVPANINRIITAKAMVTRGGAGTKCRYVATIRQGGPEGPQIGPAVTSRELNPDEFFSAAVHWADDAVPVVPGGTYALRVDSSDGGGFNCWATDSNNYAAGNMFNGSTALPGRDMIAVVVGGWSVAGQPQPTHTPGGATSTPSRTSTPSGPTATATASPTPAPDADGDNVPDLFECWPCDNTERSNRWLPDSDGDGLNDGREDTNRNGVNDFGETYARFQDSDGDGLEDGIEAYLGTNPRQADLPWPDADGDGLPDLFDVAPNNVDGDGDGFRDGYETAHLGLEAAANAAVFPPLADLNLDTWVTNIDALIIQTVFLGLSSPEQSAIRNGDTNRDGFITNLDALLAHSFFLRIFQTLPAGGPSVPPPATPTPTGVVPTHTPTVTATPTVAVKVLWQVPFETFYDVTMSEGITYKMPLLVPGDISSRMTPVSDRQPADWAGLHLLEGYESRSGLSFKAQVCPSGSQRTIGAEWHFRGATAFPAGRTIVVRVWTTCNPPTGASTDLIVGWAPGSVTPGTVQGYTRYSRRTNQSGWQQQTLTFTANTDTAVGDRILLAFAAQVPSGCVEAFFDDLVITAE